MNRKRILLATSILVVTLVAGFGLIRANTAAAQQSAPPEIEGGSIPKAWGKFVEKDIYLTGGAALLFEAPDGTIRIVKISGRGQPEEVTVLRRR